MYIYTHIYREGGGGGREREYTKIFTPNLSSSDTLSTYTFDLVCKMFTPNLLSSDT